MLRRTFLALSLLALSACANPDDLNEPPVDLGNFSLGHNIVVAPNPTKGPLSRDKPKEELIAAVQERIQERFGRYEGEKTYHFGVSIEGYVLARAGIPIVAAPKSVIIVRVTVWDDAVGKKLNEEAHQIVVFEQLSGESVLSSGLTQSAEKQLEKLAKNAAKMIERWLVEQKEKEGWFTE